MSTPPGSLEEIVRIEGGRVLATIIRLTGDIGLAEDAVQDAVLIAMERWPGDGVPRNPAAWLTTVARNKALDRIRREASRQDRERVAVDLEGGGDDEWHFSDSTIRDDQLRLLFTCCHPALSADARVALALRTIGGLRTHEIAAAFLVPEATIGQRISRAKRKIAIARVPYRVPSDAEIPDRLAAVLAVVSVIFTAGHHAASGRADARVDLADEGVRLARLLVSLMPDEPECEGFLALVLATHARRGARLGDRGELVLMADQDRGRWDRAAIREAADAVERALRRRRPGPFQIQGAIACLHGLADTYAETDWAQIAELYAFLEQQQPTAVVRVNRAVAVAEVSGAGPALALLDAFPGGFDHVRHWHLYWSVRSDLLRRCGRIDDAVVALDAALACEMNDSDRALLTARRAGLASGRFSFNDA